MFCSRFVVLFVRLFIFVGIFPWVISSFIVFPIVVMFLCCSCSFTFFLVWHSICSLVRLYIWLRMFRLRLLLDLMFLWFSLLVFLPNMVCRVLQLLCKLCLLGFF